MLEQIKGNMAQDSEVLRAVTDSGTLVIFTKGNIHHSMQAIFNVRVSAYRVQ